MTLFILFPLPGTLFLHPNHPSIHQPVISESAFWSQLNHHFLLTWPSWKDQILFKPIQRNIYLPSTVLMTGSTSQIFGYVINICHLHKTATSLNVKKTCLFLLTMISSASQTVPVIEWPCTLNPVCICHLWDSDLLIIPSPISSTSPSLLAVTHETSLLPY